MTVVGAALIAVLLALAGLHLYWGVGGFWPGHDAESLRLSVVGTRFGRMPGLVACVMVAAALAAAAAVVFAGQGQMSAGVSGWIVYGGYGVLILVFGLRGLAPYLTTVFDYARGTPFFGLNRLYYAPLCLLIAAGLVQSFPSGVRGALERLGG